MGYTASPDALEKAGKSTRSAGEQAGHLKLEPPAVDLAGALPGSKSADAAKRVGQSWAKAVTDWSRSALDHGEALTRTGGEYRNTDQAGAAGINAGG